MYLVTYVEGPNEKMLFTWGGGGGGGAVLNQYFVLQIEDWSFLRIFLDRASDQTPDNIYLFNQSQQ